MSTHRTSTVARRSGCAGRRRQAPAGAEAERRTRSNAIQFTSVTMTSFLVLPVLTENVPRALA